MVGFFSSSTCSCSNQLQESLPPDRSVVVEAGSARYSGSHSQPETCNRGCSFINCEHVGSVRELRRPVRMDWSTVKTDTTSHSQDVQSITPPVWGEEISTESVCFHETGLYLIGVMASIAVPLWLCGCQFESDIRNNPERGEVRS